MAGRNDVPQEIQSQLLKAWPASASKVVPAKFREVFEEISDSRYQVILSALQARAEFTEFGSGTVVPNRDAFQSAAVTITPVKLGEKKTWQFETVQEVRAAINTDIVAATDVWAMAAENTMDRQCTKMLKDATTTGYDGKVLYATDHPQRSRFGDGDTFSNTNETAADLSHAVVRDLITLLSDTNAISEAGDKMDLPVTHLVVAGMAHFMELLPIIESPQRAGTGNNDINPLGRLGIRPVLWTNLAGATPYLYAFSKAPGARNMVYVKKQGTIIETQYNFDTKEYESTAHQSGKPAYVDFRATARKKLNAVA